MTARDAFAIAFDDAIWAMDAMPGNDMPKNIIPSKPSAPSGLKKNAAAAPGADTSLGGEKSLSQHMQEGCEALKNGHPERCPYVQKMAKDLERSQGLAHDAAMKQAIGLHNSAGMHTVQSQQQNQQQPQTIPQEQIVQQMVQNPQTIESASSQMLAQTEELNTSAGEIPVQTTVQKAIVENLENAAAAGDSPASEALGELKEKVEDGEIDVFSEQPADGSEQSTEQKEEQQPAQPTMEFSSSDGYITIAAPPQAVAMMQESPEKEEIFQKMVDIAAAIENTTDAAERKDLNNSYAAMERLFYGDEKDTATRQEQGDGIRILYPGKKPWQGFNKTELSKKQQNDLQHIQKYFPDLTEEKYLELLNQDLDNSLETAVEELRKLDNQISRTVDNNDKARGIKDTLQKRQEEVKKELADKLNGKEAPKLEAPSSSPPPPPPPPSGGGGPGGPTPPNNPPNPPNNPPDSSNEPSKPLRTPPSDEEFRVKGKKNEYKIDGMTYVDVSGKGLLRTMLSSFIAGLQGKGIITGWDRITGTWDEMKRSAKGEDVRAGIEEVFANLGIENLENSITNPIAKAKLNAIKRQIESAKTPAQELKAYNELEKWRQEYEGEIEDVRPVKGTGGFENLSQKGKEWKAPPTSVFPPVSEDERDTSYMETMEKRINDRLEEAGVPAEIISRTNGSSVVQFKVKRLVNGTDKALQDALKAMQADIGAKISYTPDTTSGEERVGTITINNPKVKDASMQRLLEDEEAVKKAKKMEVPLLLGETAEGRSVFVDLKDHGFLGGDSGSGKSERIIGAVSGAYAVKSPSELQVVFNAHANDADYDGFADDPHTGGIGRNVEEVAQNLANANEEWKRRQKLFAQLGVRNIADYNKAMDAAGTPEKKLPSILVITDEVTDLLAQRPELADEIDAIVRNGRKFGVAHLGITQDMGADNIPSRIKGATRMGVQSGSATASKKIFDVHAPELANLNRKGDLMVKLNGQLVRLRGTYADEETRKKLREYNTGKITVPEEVPLPEEQINAIKDAINKKAPYSMPAADGYKEAFKQLVPEGWSFSEVEVDGEKHWKVSPPKTGIKDVENPDGDKKRSEKPKGINLKSRQDAIDSIKSIKAEAMAKADADYEKDGNLDKYEKALQKIGQEEQRQMAIVNTRFPAMIENGDDIDDDDSPPEELDESGVKPEEDLEDDLALFPSPQNQIETATEGLKKQISKWQKAISSGEITAEEAKKLHADAIQRLKAAKEAVKNGIDGKKATGDQIYAILNPVQKSDVSPKPESPEPESGSGIEQDEEQINEKRRNSVPPQKGYSEKTIAGSFEATERLTPKEQKNIQERFLPNGWDFVSENKFKSPAKNQFGVIFVRNPTNGSQGRLVPDPKNPKSLRFQIDIDTTHPDFKGYVQNEKGEWELSPEALRIEEETRADRKQSKDPKKREEALKRFNRARFGHDEAPDNKTIVANAVMEALNLIET